MPLTHRPCHALIHDAVGQHSINGIKATFPARTTPPRNYHTTELPLTGGNASPILHPVSPTMTAVVPHPQT